MIQNTIYHFARPELIAPSLEGAGVIVTDVRQVDSRDDARVQLADLLAGAGGVVAEQALQGIEQPLLDSIRPVIDPMSVWGDIRGQQLARGRRRRTHAHEIGGEARTRSEGGRFVVSRVHALHSPSDVGWASGTGVTDTMTMSSINARPPATWSTTSCLLPRLGLPKLHPPDRTLTARTSLAR